MKLAALILAGGSGTRLWPASRAAAPKQYLSFDGGPSYLQQALLRARAVDSELIAVITGEEQMAAVAAQCAALAADSNAPPCYVLGEPAARNTGPAVALGVSRERTRACSVCRRSATEYGSDRSAQAAARSSDRQPRPDPTC